MIMTVEKLKWLKKAIGFQKVSNWLLYRTQELFELRKARIHIQLDRNRSVQRSYISNLYERLR